MMTHFTLKACVRTAALLSAMALAGCSMLPSIPSLPSIFGFGGAEKPKPAELPPNPALVAVRPAWTARVGPVNFPLSVNVNGGNIVLASSDGAVAVIDAASGRDVWRAGAGGPLAAGVGSDGRLVAVVTRNNELVAFVAGKEVWRQRMTAVGFTAPFVAGGRVFVLTADRAVSGYDGLTGRKLWTQQRPGEPLVLRHSGVMLAVGDTLVVGLSGRMAGLDPLSGAIRWEAPIANPRGINDVERLVDLVGTVSRIGDVVCARAFQANVGCVNAGRGNVIWTKPSNGSEGVHGDDRLVFGTESDGKVVAFSRENGDRAWVNDRLQYRELTAPLSLGRSVVIGDSAGNVHMLSREDGSLLNRLTTDGSAVAAAPVLAGNTLVVVTKSGGVFGFVPQ